MDQNLAAKDLSRREDQITNFFNSPPPTGANGPDNLILSIGSQLLLRWKTNIATVNLELFQQLDRNPSCGGCIVGPYVIASNLTVSNYTWTVTTGTLSLTPNVFFFIVHDNTSSVDTDETRFGSSYMNFTTAAVSSAISPSSTTTGISTSSTATSSSSATPISTTPVTNPSSPSPSTSSPSPQSGSSKNTLIPAILVPVLGLLIAAALGIYCFRRRRKSKPPVPPKSQSADPGFASDRLIPELERHRCGEFPRELEGTEPERMSELEESTREKRQSGKRQHGEVAVYELG